MKKRQGFTLAELVLAVFIFAYMSASLATIYGTANRHMFQNYRKNVIKTNVLLSMKTIQNNLSVATRIDLPAPGAQGDVLAFATNVDNLTGCYPVNQTSASANPPNLPAWHYFCLASDPATPGFRSLYYHTGNLPGGTACGSPAATIWCSNNPVANGCYAVPVCGSSGGTITKLMQYASPLTTFYSRRPAEEINEANTVRVTLRSYWPAPAFGSGQRSVDFSLDNVIMVNRPQ